MFVTPTLRKKREEILVATFTFSVIFRPPKLRNHAFCDLTSQVGYNGRRSLYRARYFEAVAKRQEVNCFAIIRNYHGDI